MSSTEQMQNMGKAGMKKQSKEVLVNYIDLLQGKIEELLSYKLIEERVKTLERSQITSLQYNRKSKTDDATDTFYFFDTLTSNLFVPHIIYPTRITSSTKTLIDNIFSNSTNYLLGVSGNLTISISDHLAQFLIIPEYTHKLPVNHNLYKRESSNFDKENCILELQEIDHSLFLSPTNKYEIMDMIKCLDICKAVGPNSIPTNIFQLIQEISSDPLAEITNLSFETGIYFNNLKISKTIPVFNEKGSNLECSNYRPISLLSNINKIIEKLIRKRVYNFLTSHNCIYELQFGFRDNHSTNHALINLTEDIRNALDNNTFACGVFIDLQKAFDTVDHDILLAKLEYYGVRGNANNWSKSYLTNRKQHVSINGYTSNEVEINIGVPQGSVLGPLLFLIYINDLNIALKYSTVKHFADDTTLLIKNKSLKQIKKHLNLDLRHLCKWLRANKISLNSSKTEMLLFRHPKKTVNYDLKIEN